MQKPRVGDMFLLAANRLLPCRRVYFAITGALGRQYWQRNVVYLVI